MKCLYILISFALVNVSVALDDYTKHVFGLNQQIFAAGDALQDFISDIVRKKIFNMVELALFFSIPDAEENDLGKYIIKEKIDYQRFALEKILESSNAEEKDVENYIKRLAEDSQNKKGDFEDAKLTDLAYERRKSTLKAINVLIRGVIGKKNSKFTDFSDTCNLLGLYRSVRYPETFIVAVDANEDGNCYVFDKNGISAMYNYNVGDIWEYIFKGTSFGGKPLSPQVETP